MGAYGSKSTSRAARKALTTDKVLAAAHVLFAQRGYERVGIRDVAAAAGVSTGAVFSSFKDKDALFLAATGLPAPNVRKWLAHLMQVDDGPPFGPAAEAILRKVLAQARSLHQRLYGEQA